MGSAPLNEQLDAVAVAHRAMRFPVLAQCLGERLVPVAADRPVAVSAASGLLRLLEMSGWQTHALLTALEATVIRWDALQPPGWAEVRNVLGNADRDKLLSLCAEFVVAGWASAHGLTLAAMEPKDGTGHLADFRLSIGRETLLVEVTSPRVPEASWTLEANRRLMAALERVASGLAVDVNGFSIVVSACADDARQVTRREIDALVMRFAHQAPTVERDKLPQVVVAPQDQQPVSITAVATAPEDVTMVRLFSSRSGEVPDVSRLVDKILRERRHLGGDEPGGILVDLSNMAGDFQPGDFYVHQVREQLARHASLPAFVGSFVWNPVSFRPEGRCVLHCDARWAASELGQQFLSGW